MKFVRDEGSLAAPIVVVAEAPGAQEEAIGRPLVGPSGKVLTRWWNEVGMQRSDCYLTNVCPRRPNLKNEIEAVPQAEMAAYEEYLHERIARLDNPRVLVPLGNIALQALLGFTGITRHRGYFYQYQDRRGRALTVIPSIHPASTLYQAQRQSDLPGETKAHRNWAARCILDWKRIKEESQKEEIALPERKQYILPTLNDVEWLSKEIVNLSTEHILAFDVETPRKRVKVGETKTGKPVMEWGDPYLACIGFSYDPSWAMTIPTTLDYWKSKEKLNLVYDHLRKILTARCQKATQNGHFDWFHCWLWLGVWPVNWRWDSLALDHQRDPIEQHSLEFQASIHLRTTYWKDENKEADESSQEFLKDYERAQAYNGKDAHHTRELIDVHLAANNIPWYQKHYESLFLPVLNTMIRGIRVDNTRRLLQLARLTAEAITLRARLTALAGDDLYGPTALSPTKLSKYLYETLQLPKQKVKDHKKGVMKVTTNEVAVRRLAIKYPEQFGEAAECILGARRVNKKKEFYDDSLVDPDGFTRCQYGFTETLRLRSWGNPMRRGRNHQNFDRECRSHLRPDPGHVWLEPDASQVEDRICKVMTGDPHLIELAYKPPWEWDAHRYNASVIFGISMEQVDNETRQAGKIFVHAAQRDMTGPTCADMLLKEIGLVKTPEECQEGIEAYFSGGHQAIRDVYFREVRHRIIHERKLTNSWSFTIRLDHEPLDAALYRRGYSFFMQSENGMNTNYLAWVPTYEWLVKNKLRSRILLQGHDSLGISAHPDEVYDLMCQVRLTWEVERCYWGTPLTVPICWKLGVSYGHFVAEWKKFPTLAEVKEAIQLCLDTGTT